MKTSEGRWGISPCDKCGSRDQDIQINKDGEFRIICGQHDPDWRSDCQFTSWSESLEVAILEWGIDKREED